MKNTPQKEFLNAIFFQNAWQAAVTTRNHEFPVFDSKADDKEKLKFRTWCEIRCNELIEEYQKNKEGDHVQRIEKFVQEVNDGPFKAVLDGNFRFGIAQKLINLYFKFRWCAGDIQSTPHCPMDNVVKSALESRITSVGIELKSWTSMNRTDYEKYLDAFKVLEINEYAMEELRIWNEYNSTFRIL